MSVTCKPVGRGNWASLVLTYAGPQMAPFVVRVGEQFNLAGIVWRVCKVEA